jgi:hypothetical protein
VAENAGELTARLRADIRDFQRGFSDARATLAGLVRSTKPLDVALQQNAETLRRWQSQLKQAMGQVGRNSPQMKIFEARLKDVDTAIDRLPPVTKKATLQLGTLRSSMGSLAFAAAGLPGRMGMIASSLLSMASGAGLAVGAFAALAAGATVFRLITKDAREAKEAVEGLMKSSATLQRLDLEEQIGQAREARDRQVRRLEGTRELLAMADPGGDAAYGLRRTLAQLETELGRMNIGIHEAEIKLDELGGAAAALKRELAALADRLVRIAAPAHLEPPGVTPRTIMGQAEALRGLVAGPSRGPVRPVSDILGGPAELNRRVQSIAGGVTGRDPVQAQAAMAEIQAQLRAFGATVGDLVPALQANVAQIEVTATELPTKEGGPIGKALEGFKGGIGQVASGFASFLSPIGLASIGLQAFGISTQDITKVIGKAISFLIKILTIVPRLLAKIPFIGKPFQKMVEGIDFVSDKFGNLGKEAGRLGDSARATSDALANIPHGVKVALARFNAIATTTPGVSGLPGGTRSPPTGTGATERSESIIPGVVINIHGITDPARVAERVSEELRRIGTRGGTHRGSLAFGAS